MAKFYGTVQGSRGQASRLGHESITTVAASWEGAVRVHLTEEHGEIIATVSLIKWRGHGIDCPLWRGRVNVALPATKDTGQ